MMRSASVSMPLGEARVSVPAGGNAGDDLMACARDSALPGDAPTNSSVASRQTEPRAAKVVEL